MAEAQRILHIVTEFLAIPMGIFLIYLGLTLQTKRFNKVALVVLGAGNLLIDGYMLTTWW